MIMRSETNQMERDQMSKYGHIVLSDERPGIDIEAVADDIRSIVKETIFISNWTIIEGYWAVGQRLRTEGEAITQLVQRVALKAKVSRRTLMYCLKFYDTIPDLQLLKEGKDISWRKIIQKYLTEGKEPETVKELRDSLLNMSFQSVFEQVMQSDSKETAFDVPGGKLTVRFTSSEVVKVDNRNHDVQTCLDYWTELMGAGRITKFDRFAISNLLKAKYLETDMPQFEPVERVKQLIQAVNILSGERFAPTVSSPSDMHSKYNQIKAFLKKKGGPKILSLRKEK